jgi:hypothetical protein
MNFKAYASKWSGLLWFRTGQAVGCCEKHNEPYIRVNIGFLRG